jgi:hypothetical protein
MCAAVAGWGGMLERLWTPVQAAAESDHRKGSSVLIEGTPKDSSTPPVLLCPHRLLSHSAPVGRLLVLNGCCNGIWCQVLWHLVGDELEVVGLQALQYSQQYSILNNGCTRHTSSSGQSSYGMG